RLPVATLHGLYEAEEADRQCCKRHQCLWTTHFFHCQFPRPTPNPASTTERRKVAPDVLAIRPLVEVGAGRRQTIVPVCEINEAHFVERARIEVIRRIIAARRRDDDVSPEFVSGEIESERI